MSAISASKWPVFDKYELSQDGTPVGTDLRTWIDLSDENQQESMFKDWLEKDVSDWIQHYGLPFDSREFYPDEGMEWLSVLSASARSMREHWDRYKKAKKNPDQLKGDVWVLSDPFFDPRLPLAIGTEPFRIMAQETEGLYQESFSPIEEWMRYGCVNEDLIPLGQDNFRRSLADKDILRSQYSKLKSSADQLRRSGADVERFKESHPDTVYIGFGKLRYECPAVEFEHDPLGTAQTFALHPLRDYIEGGLRGLSPSLLIERDEDGDIHYRHGWPVTSPFMALCLAAWRKVTRADLLEVCPHPKCGAIYEKTRSNRASCGAPRCRQYVKRQRRAEREGL